jgi:predicted nicotinamide N-methyase
VGIIARDCRGKFLGARGFFQKIKVDAKLPETIAALGAIKFGTEAGFFYAICEGDAAKVVADINSDPPCLSNTGHFIESIHMVKLGLHSCCFVLAPREANTAVHTLTK